MRHIINLIRVILLCGGVLPCSTSTAQNVQFNVDISNSVQTLELLQNQEIQVQDLTALFALPTTEYLLRKLALDSTELVSALRKAKEGMEPDSKEARLQYDKIIDNIDSISTFVEQIDKESSDLVKYLNDSLSQYFPDQTNTEVVIHVMLGGWATGYTFDDLPNEFFVSIQKIPLDMEVLYALCEHELFHNIQAASYTIASEVAQLDSLGLIADAVVLSHLNNLWREGSATFIAEPTKYRQSPGIVKYFESNLRNTSRVTQAYFILDRMTVDAYESGGPKPNTLYQTFFSPAFDQVGYYIGSHMLQSIMDGLSDQERMSKLKFYLQHSPTYFVLDYVSLSNKFPQNHYRFSKEFITITKRLHYTVVDKAVEP